MPDVESNSPSYLCKDCEQPMELIQQSDANGGVIPLVTCWQSSCPLRGVTLSVEQYALLTEDRAEAYRQMNLISRAKYVNSDG